MTLLRALSAETLKIKRTLALKMVVLAPVAVVLLTLFMASQAPFTTLRRSPSAPEPWRVLARINLQFWALLMLPLYVTLQTALIAGLDHADNQWKALFARPVPRWNSYMAKLILVAVMVTASGAILVVGILAEGRLMHLIHPDLGFGAPAPFAPIVGQAARMTGLAFLFVTIQHWVSLRWRSFSVAIGFGIVAMVTGFGMLLAAGPYGAWPQYFPWSLPMLVLARQPQNVPAVLWICGLAAVVTTAAGCIDFCRREIS
jgi:lantibiotic transport system permease protein